MNSCAAYDRHVDYPLRLLFVQPFRTTRVYSPHELYFSRYSKDLFESDLKVIRLMAHAMAAFDQQTDGTDRDWINMYDQQRRLLYR